ncbi:MAG: hypothetical protein WHS63_07525 [Tenuifilum sp.]|uniref:hypothetical protein n=1 Tax=Tenuifilum sp. TaxID=2760880 RepID=UPI0030B12F7E
MANKPYAYRRILIIALLLTAFSLLYAVFISQDKKFSGQVPLFPAELNSLVSDKVKEQEEVFLKGFPAFWLSDTIEISKKEAIIVTANQILEVLPDDKSYILSYVKLIACFYRNQYAKNQFETWFSYLNMALADGFIKSDNLRTLIRFSGSLIDSSFISINTSHTWKVLPANSYNFTLKNNDLLVRFQNINLICRNNRTDSIFIRGTSGNLDIIKQSWEGKNGKVTWIRSKFDESKIFVALNRYRIELRQSEYTADSVLLNYPEYFKKPILGRIVDKVTPIYQSGIVDYPEFNPYQKWFEVKNIFKDVDYSGNFRINGSKLVGIGPDGSLAKVTIHRKGKPFMVAEGRMVLIEQSHLSSDKAKVVFYIDKDSIYHNGLSFAYHNPTRTVMVNPTDKLTTQSPFYSSYHKINLWSNHLTWNIEKDEITFGSSLGASISKAEFESENFFNQDLFDSMMDASEFHPVLTVWNYTRRIKSNTFLASDLAVHVRRAPEDVKIAMMRLAKLGYVLYNFETDEVTITDKLKYNVMARFGRTDFDVIRFQSTTPGTQPNARLDLNNLNLAIEGVNYISVSDSQNVFISPYKKSITFQKNRNFEFGGSVRAGLFTFYGKAFRFDYSQFKVELNKVDSLIIDYQTDYRDNYGRRILQGVANALHIISGDILIDKPYNKSGREYNPQYPIFNCTSKSYVYYDASYIYGGIYKRDSFYFEIQPFVYQNMDNFEKADMNFKGILYSGNILAPIEETLRIRPDNSLGFITTTPSEGMAVYKGKGRVFNKIDLSNQGLFVNGSIDYITSTTQSDKMLLFPDSMVTVSTGFSIAKRETGIEFPNVKGNKHSIKWLPKADKMFISKGEKPFVMYDSLATFSGNLLLQPLGLTGAGLLNVPNGKLSSSLFEYSSNALATNESTLTIYKTNSDSVALETTKVKATINFANMLGEFSRVDKSIYASLDALRYSSYHDRFKWDLKGYKVYFETLMAQEDVLAGKFRVSNMIDRDSIPRGNLFFSTKPAEDSLYFFAPKAVYNTDRIHLVADSVKYIVTADATVFPKNKRVEVDVPNRMYKFSNAKVRANNTTAYHVLHDAEIKINGRKSYGGSAYYDYVDERDSIQTIYFPKVYSDNNMNTYAEGTLTEPDSFRLSSNFAYIGGVSLSAPEKFLFFKGGAKPIYNCPGTIGQWVRFESQINPKRVLIPIGTDPRNMNLHRLISGTAIAEDSLKLYGGLLRSRKFWEDSSLVTATGFMEFNNKNRRFTIAPLYKLDNPDSSGNSVSLQKDYCWAFGEGNVRLPLKLGHVTSQVYGSVIHKLEKNEATIDAIIRLNFHFNQKALEAMAAQLSGAITLDKVDLSRKLYRKMLYDWLTPKELPEALNQLSLFGSFTQMPKSLESTITLSDVKLRWDPQNKSFVSVGKIGVGTIGNIQVNRFVNGFIEYYKGRFNDRLILYIHIGDNEYYSFYYANGVMFVSATNPEFYNPIASQKSSERRVKPSKGMMGYRYMIGSKRELNRAQLRYKELAFGIKSDIPVDSDDDKPNKEGKEED